MKIDVHSHVILPSTFGKAGKYGPNLRVDGEFAVLEVGGQSSRRKLGPEEAKTIAEDPAQAFPMLSGSPDTRVELMNGLEVDVMGVSVTPLFYMYWAEPDIGAEFAAIQNDALAAFCNDHPHRLFFLATLPLQDLDASIAEMQRAVQLGARGINLAGGNIAGRELDDPDFFPLYERAASLGLPLAVHPYPEPLSEGRGDDYNISWIVGYLAQETTAFVRLIYGGVLDEFPDLKVYITHGGGFVPYQIGRIRSFAPAMPGVKAKRPVDDYLDQFYFDVLIHDIRARQFLVDMVGPDHLVFGSNFGSAKDAAGFHFLDELDLDAESREKISSGTASQLFKL